MRYKIVADGFEIAACACLSNLDFQVASHTVRWEVRVSRHGRCDRIIAMVCMVDRPRQLAWAVGTVIEELKAREAAGTLLKRGVFQVGDVFRPGYGLPYTSERQEECE